MNYVLLISHGTVAAAMHETLNMFFLGRRPELLHACLLEGMSPDAYAESVKETLSVLNEEDQLIVVADMVGGSPLTYASYAVNQMGLLSRTNFLCGMNMPVILELMSEGRQNLSPQFLEKARSTIRPFSLASVKSECSAEYI